MIYQKIIILVIFFIEIVRYFPQLKQDYYNKKRPIKIKINKIRIKASYIWLINILIYLIFLFKLSSNIVELNYIILGLPIYFIGVIIGWIGFYHLKNQYHEEILRFHDNDILIKNGIYSIVRHPLRIGLFLEILGITIISSSILSFILLLFILFFQLYRTNQEEIFLIKNFGDEYIEYSRMVPKYNVFLGIFNKYFRPQNTLQVTKAIRNAGDSNK